MTERTEGPEPRAVTWSASLEAVSRLADNAVKSGTSASLGLAAGRVSITLDGSGDWTITVALPPRPERNISSALTLEKLGFFRAVENDGAVYYLWTSALKDAVDERSLVERTLFETLSALESTAPTRYIC